MSDELLASLVTVVLIALMFAWVPLLKLVCPPCSRFLLKRRRKLPVGRRTSFVVKREVI